MIYLDQFKCNSLPINIPKDGKNEYKIRVSTISMKEIFLVTNDISDNLIIGCIVNTPPESKKYAKGDKILIHSDHIHEIY